jgi:hypothetical protein
MLFDYDSYELRRYESEGAAAEGVAQERRVQEATRIAASLPDGRTRVWRNGSDVYTYKPNISGHR